VIAPATTSILWFRRDLRLNDHPALLAAVHEQPAVVVTATLPEPPAAANDWLAGARLTRFEVKDPGDVMGVNLRSQITLYLQDRRGQSLSRLGDHVDQH